MPIKDEVLAWFVKEYIIPRSQVLDTPGFITFNISGKNPLYIRQVIFPELFFLKLEKVLASEFSEQGKKKLYAIGKQFGYNFATMGSFSTQKDIPQKKFEEYVKLISKFIEGTYASEITTKINLTQQVITYELRNFIVCNKSGSGYFLPLGAAAGLVSKMLNNNKIEGIQIKCQGRGDEKCTIVYGPINYLKKEYPNELAFEYDQLEEPTISIHYKEFNTEKKITNSTFSFKKYLDSGIFSYDHGIVMHNNQRFFIFEVSGIYLLSKGFESEQKFEKVIYNCAFETGKEIIDSFNLHQGNLQSLIDLLTSFGWGEVNVYKKDEKIILSFKYFPWTEFSENSKYSFFRGYFSGILSGYTSKETHLNYVNTSITSGTFVINFTT